MQPAKAQDYRLPPPRATTVALMLSERHTLMAAMEQMDGLLGKLGVINISDIPEVLPDQEKTLIVLARIQALQDRRDRSQATGVLMNRATLTSGVLYDMFKGRQPQAIPVGKEANGRPRYMVYYPAFSPEGRLRTENLPMEALGDMITLQVHELGHVLMGRFSTKANEMEQAFDPNMNLRKETRADLMAMPLLKQLVGTEPARRYMKTFIEFRQAEARFAGVAHSHFSDPALEQRMVSFMEGLSTDDLRDAEGMTRITDKVAEFTQQLPDILPKPMVGAVSNVSETARENGGNDLAQRPGEGDAAYYARVRQAMCQVAQQFAVVPQGQPKPQPGEELAVAYRHAVVGMGANRQTALQVIRDSVAVNTFNHHGRGETASLAIESASAREPSPQVRELFVQAGAAR